MTKEELVVVAELIRQLQEATRDRDDAKRCWQEAVKSAADLRIRLDAVERELREEKTLTSIEKDAAERARQALREATAVSENRRKRWGAFHAAVVQMLDYKALGVTADKVKQKFMSLQAAAQIAETKNGIMVDAQGRAI